jgi:hypothetical protein
MDNGFYSYGVYRIKHPLLSVIRPKLIIDKDAENSKPKGHVKGLFFGKDLALIKAREPDLVYQLSISVFFVEIILHFVKDTAFEGILDTPIGHLRFKGQLK